VCSAESSQISSSVEHDDGRIFMATCSKDSVPLPPGGEGRVSRRAALVISHGAQAADVRLPVLDLQGLASHVEVRDPTAVLGEWQVTGGGASHPLIARIAVGAVP
jgi:hypothetical protein